MLTKGRRELQDHMMISPGMGEVISSVTLGSLLKKQKPGKNLKKGDSEIFKSLEAEGYRTTTLLNERSRVLFSVNL